MNFSNSSLVQFTKISPNKDINRNHAIDTITIHCVVGQCSIETLGNIFYAPSKRASSNYGVGYDGRIGMYVEEKDRSWCSSSPSNDHRAITIEVASDTYAPYAVTQAAYNSTIELVTDICKRNGIKKLVWSTNKNERMNHLNGCNMTVHRDYANKSCPGEYLYNRMGDIAKKVNEKLGSETVEPSDPIIPPVDSLKIGDIVDFLGGAHYASSNATQPAAGSLKGGKAKITNIANGKHPYHLVHIDSSCAVYGWVNLNQIKHEEEEEIPNNDTIEVNDIVNYLGGSVYASASASTPSATNVKAGKARITRIYNGKHPYHLIYTDNQSTVYGWVDANTIANNNNKPPVSTTFKVGDKVKVKKGAKTYTGGNIASFVYENTYTIDELVNDRAVLDKTGICTPVNIKDLEKISSNTSNSSSQTIRVGDKVKVRSGAKTYTGGNLASFVYSSTYTVFEISGNRVVIGSGNTVTAAVKLSDLIKL